MIDFQNQNIWNPGINPAFGSHYSPSTASVTHIGTGTPTDRIPDEVKLPAQIEKEKEEHDERLGIKDPTKECQTCKNRRYVDGSDEMVSYKVPTRISPERAGTAVRAHEQEHVNNAYTEAANHDGEVLSATVQIHMSICPECGKAYVEGGTTSTRIKYHYNDESNPYQKDLKANDHEKFTGMNSDYQV